MGTTRGLERLIFFTDAVAAIAITLLILPLVDIVPQAAAHGAAVWPLLVQHRGQIFSFVLSFAVIGRLWIAHHAIFEHVKHYNGRMLVLTLVWTFTIVLLPLPTAITAAYDPGPGPVALYIGTMTLNSLALTLIAITVRGNPVLEDAENPIPLSMLAGSIGVTATFAVALILGTAIPAVSYWGLLLLFLTAPADSLARRILVKRGKV